MASLGSPRKNFVQQLRSREPCIVGAVKLCRVLHLLLKSKQEMWLRRCGRQFSFARLPVGGWQSRVAAEQDGTGILVITELNHTLLS